MTTENTTPTTIVQTLETVKDLIKLLTESRQVTVTFLKLDKSIRTMKCTLHPEIAQYKIPTTELTSIPNAIAVYDVVEKGWRSFRTSSVISITKDSE